MDFAIFGTLAVLALVDGTSIGTLAIPAWLTLQSGVRPRVIATYLVVIAVFYWLVGLALLSGASVVLTEVIEATDGEPRSWAQLALGVVLVASAFVVDPIGGKKERAERPRRPGRLDRMKARVGVDGLTGRGAAGLALGAGAIEVATMLPYLGAIALLVDASPGFGVSAAVLVAYCMLMVVPAAALLGMRMAGERRAERLLAAVQGWVERNSAKALGVVLLIAGLYLANGAAKDLGLLG